MSVLTVTNVSKVYRRIGRASERAVDGLTLEVPEGGVFGFLGPNGSGKTTTIRMLLGLARPTSGSLSVLGHPVPRGLVRALPQVGSLVELPTLFPSFTGRENLRLLARTAGLSDTRVEECLELVGLGDRARDRVKGYSLGMRQRLAIAAALLKRPRLLLLDEPTNGLDPGGIREVRDLIRTMGASGSATVFLSSHLLGEVRQTCDRVAILAKGRCVASGAVSDVLSGGSGTVLRVRVSNPAAAGSILRDAGLTVREEGDALLLENAGDPAKVTALLAGHGIYLSELTPVERDLETVFLELTSSAQNEGAPREGP